MLKKIIFSLAHIIFWAVFLAISLEAGFKVSEGWDLFLHIYPVYLVQLVWASIAVYLFYFWLADYLFVYRKPVKYLLVSLSTSVIIGTFFYFLIYLAFPNVRISMNARLYGSSTISTFILSQMGTVLRAFVNWYNEQESKAEIEKVNLQNELSMLKTQINPHFLFNTLNNIDAMIRTDADQASKAIIQLSGMMRYLLYDTDSEYVTLEQERKYLDDLISLHRLRHASAEAIRYNVDIRDEQVKMVPLILLPFVENAFKYASQKENQPLVSIDISDNSRQLNFSCSNYFNPMEINLNPKGGLGIANAKKRMEVYYKNRHTLSIIEEKDYYCVEIKIQHHD